MKVGKGCKNFPLAIERWMGSYPNRFETETWMMYSIYIDLGQRPHHPFFGGAFGHVFWESGSVGVR